MKESYVFTEETTVPIAEISKLLGITARWARQLTEDGVFIKAEERGRYKLIASIQSYVKRIEGKSEEAASEEKESLKKKLDAEAKLKAAQAKKAEIELRELEGKMHSAKDVEILTNEFVYAVRSNLMAFPGRCATDLVNEVEKMGEAEHGKKIAAISDLLRKEINKMMNELSEYEYDPDKFAELVESRQKWEGVSDD